MRKQGGGSEGERVRTLAGEEKWLRKWRGARADKASGEDFGARRNGGGSEEKWKKGLRDKYGDGRRE